MATDRTMTDTRFEFTRARIDAATCLPGKSQTLYSDTRQPGLGLRVASGGRKTFIFEAKLGRQTIRLTIGDASMPIRVPKDRKGNPTGPGADGVAAEYLALIRAGRDPREVVKARTAADSAARDAVRARVQRETLTGLEAWATYCTARFPHWGDHHRADHTQMTAGPHAPLFALLGKPLHTIDRASVSGWLALERARSPSMALKGLNLLRAFLRWCARQGLPGDPAAVQVDREERPRLKPRKGALQREQLPQWFAAVQGLRNPVTRAYLIGLLLTGARRRELSGLRWEDVQPGQITIRDKGTTEGADVGTRTIPLTPYLASLLEDLPKVNGFVFFSTTSADGTIEQAGATQTKMLKRAGLPHLSLHDLRRSFSNLSEWVEAPVGVVAQIMGHAPSATTERHYKNRPIDLLRLWHTRIENFIITEAGVK